MAEAYVIEAIRTAGGRRGGKLAGWHPADLAGEALSALVERSGGFNRPAMRLLAAGATGAQPTLRPVNHVRKGRHCQRDHL